MKAQALDKFMLVERLKEEQILLRTEMMNFLSFYLENILPKLRQKKMDIDARIGGQLLRPSQTRMRVDESCNSR